MAATLAPEVDLLEAVVEQVWSAMLHQPPSPWTASWPMGLAGTQAEISIGGDWSGHLRLWSSAPGAESMTRALLALDERPEADDVVDALGEVLNVVAGGVKAAVGGSSVLGLPRVSAAPAAELPAEAVHLTVAWHDAPVLISIIPTP